MMKRIENFIEHLECPIVNGIMFPDETVKLMHVEVDWSKPINYIIKKGSSLPVKGQSVDETLQRTNCTVLCELIDQENNIQILSGEGGFGGDGFVAIIDLVSKKTRWLAFFDCSNPFNKLNVRGEALYASSTLDCVWMFNIGNPIDFLIECG